MMGLMREHWDLSFVFVTVQKVLLIPLFAAPFASML